MHFIQRKQFSETNVHLHAFQQISDLKTFPECVSRPLKTLWLVTCCPRDCSWTILIYLMQDQIHLYLYSCIACESQSFKRVFYLKQIFVITGAPLERRARGNCPPPQSGPVHVGVLRNAIVSRYVTFYKSTNF